MGECVTVNTNPFLCNFVETDTIVDSVLHNINRDRCRPGTHSSLNILAENPYAKVSSVFVTSG